MNRNSFPVTKSYFEISCRRSITSSTHRGPNAKSIPPTPQIYRAREQLLAEFNGDIHACIEDARKRALQSEQSILTAARQSNTEEDSHSNKT